MGAFERPVAAMLPAIAVLAIAGCGGGSGTPTMVPLSVSLSPSTVTVSQSGAPTHVQIFIMSTSETARVSFTGLPGGVLVTYATSDTNPSGLLTFMANASTSAGTYMPMITVNSAGQTATVKFTLIVSAAMASRDREQPAIEILSVGGVDRATPAAKTCPWGGRAWRDPLRSA